jgi:hypothetical protein
MLILYNTANNFTNHINTNSKSSAYVAVMNKSTKYAHNYTILINYCDIIILYYYIH